jgi:tetratricopeptide (TPR) repeat protein
MKQHLIVGVVAALGLAVALGSQRAGRRAHGEVALGDDAYLLPPPAQLERLSLGYRSALADLLWADLLVTQGLRLGERRRYGIGVEYLRAITRLDPEWRDPYRLAQPLVTLQTEKAPLDEVLELKEILVEGLKRRPTDAELHLVVGSFMVYVAPDGYLSERPELAAAWREEGAEYLARAAELAPEDSSIVWQAIGGDRFLIQTGQLDRAIELYTRVLATTEDPELRVRIESNLALMRDDRLSMAQKVRESERKARAGVINRALSAAYPVLAERNRLASLAFLMPRPRDSSRCAGGARASGSALECARTWSSFATIDPFGGATPSVAGAGPASSTR